MPAARGEGPVAVDAGEAVAERRGGGVPAEEPPPSAVAAAARMFCFGCGAVARVCACWTVVLFFGVLGWVCYGSIGPFWEGAGALAALRARGGRL